MDQVQVLLQVIDKSAGIPQYAHPGDAGADLITTEDCVLAPGERAILPTGLAIALPEGYVAYVMPRSGLAAKQGVTVINAPGVVDAGYRGEVKVALVNLNKDQTVSLAKGDRIAQLVIQKVEKANFIEVEQLPETARGAGGYGSTGGFTKQ